MKKRGATTCQPAPPTLLSPFATLGLALPGGLGLTLLASGLGLDTELLTNMVAKDSRRELHLFYGVISYRRRCTVWILTAWAKLEDT